MKKCKTCIYWGGIYVPKNGVADCEAADWMIDDFAERGLNMDADEMAIHADASDDSGLTALLVTGEDFGCTLHSPKK